MGTRLGTTNGVEERLQDRSQGFALGQPSTNPERQTPQALRLGGAPPERRTAFQVQLKLTVQFLLKSGVVLNRTQ